MEPARRWGCNGIEKEDAAVRVNQYVIDRKIPMSARDLPVA